MTQLVLGPNRAYPAVPTIGQDLESHSRAIEAITEALQIHERRTNEVLDSFVRVRELETLGLVTIDGKIVTVVPSGGGGGGLNNIVEDTTPQLGGDLDLNGFGITDTSAIDLTIAGTDRFRVFGTGASLLAGGILNIYDTTNNDRAYFNHDGTDFNTTLVNTIDWNITGASFAAFKVGNYHFNVDQTVGAGQDNYVLTYDNASGEIGLEAAAGGAATPNIDLFNYNFNTSVAAGDPGTGNVAFNNATLSSANLMYISDTDADGNSLDTFLDSFPLGATIRFRTADLTIYANFRVRGVSTDSGTYHQISVNHIASNGGTPTNGQALVMELSTNQQIPVPSTDRAIIRASTSGSFQGWVEQTDVQWNDPDGRPGFTFTEGGLSLAGIGYSSRTLVLRNNDASGSLELKAATIRFQNEAGTTRLTVGSSGVSWASGTAQTLINGAFNSHNASSINRFAMGWSGNRYRFYDSNGTWSATGDAGYQFEDVPIYIEERAFAKSNTAGYGQLWVANLTPNRLKFSDDAGTNFTVALLEDVQTVSGAWTFSGAGVFSTSLNAVPLARSISATTNTATTDYGIIIRMTGGTGQTLTLDSDPPANSVVLLDNSSGFLWTIAASPSTNLIWAKDGTTGNRTLADDGVACAIHRGSGVWIISGSALLT